MALDSNAMKDLDGTSLPHFTPYASPFSEGVNFFAQDLASGAPLLGKPYVFPPLIMVGPVLRLLKSHRLSCTLVTLDVYPRKFWWPILQACSVKSWRIARVGTPGILLVPAKDGWTPHAGIPGDLWELPATAKLFVLSVRCPTCGHANDHDFHFCQRCGYRRHVVTSVWRVGKEVDVDTIDRRLDQLTVWDQSTNYAKQKDSLQRSLETFLSSLPGRPSIHTGSPRDICRFLVYKDKDGRTQVHRNGCKFLGQRGIQACGCPLRLAYNTVDSYIGKLRSIFHAVGREGEWDRRLGLGNPAAGKVVKDYLRLVTAEQLQARISPRQAMPFFVDKLVQLSSHLHKALESPGVTPLQRFILARDQAYLKAVFFSGDRPGDMGQ
ncbi:hypothetical protein QZH41_002166, partial [Actinostola sp. cb2023]